MTPPLFHVRALTAADGAALRPVRLDALRLHPEAYGASYEEEAQAPPDDLTRRLLLPPSTTFGGFADDRLVGTTGLLCSTRTKQRHIGHLFFVYVEAGYRRSGLSRALIRAALAQARSEALRVVQLNVTVGNESARRLYAAFGFQTYGIERRALLVDGRFHDTEHMALDLD